MGLPGVCVMASCDWVWRAPARCSSAGLRDISIGNGPGFGCVDVVLRRRPSSGSSMLEGSPNWDAKGGGLELSCSLCSIDMSMDLVSGSAKRLFNSSSFVTEGRGGLWASGGKGCGVPWRELELVIGSWIVAVGGIGDLDRVSKLSVCLWSSGGGGVSSESRLVLPCLTVGKGDNT